nr:hypothetical protein [Tanacetum cinerariifolium]
MTARISIPALVPVPAWSDSEIVRLLAMSSPPSLPSSPWSSPVPQILFPPLPLILSPPSPMLSPAPPPSPIQIRELHTTDRRRQIVISEMLRADHRRSTDIIRLRTAL